MILKIVKERQNVKVDILDGATLEDLISVIQDKFQIQVSSFDLLLGYPPKNVASEGTASLISLGFKSGEVVTLRENTRKKEICDGLAAMGFSAALITRTLNALDATSYTLDNAIEICMLLSAAEDSGDLPRQKVARRVIDADNSCLFNAVGFALCGGTLNFHTFDPMSYRRVIAEAVLADPITYTTDMLEKPPQEYAQWILNPDKWGGEIELYILAQHLHVEIVAVDIRTGNLLTYSAALTESSTQAETESPTLQDQDRRIYVLYDGIHYDAITRPAGPGSRHPEECLFSRTDQDTLEEVKELAKKLRESKQFTSLSTGGLECKICFARMDGEKAAVEHAKATGHQNFGQV